MKQKFEKKAVEESAKKEEVKEERFYVAKFGKFGKEVSVKCYKNEEGKFVGFNGEVIPDWAEVE